MAVAYPVSVVIYERLRSSGFAWLGPIVTFPLIGLLVTWVVWVSVVRLRRHRAPGGVLGPL